MAWILVSYAYCEMGAYESENMWYNIGRRKKSQKLRDAGTGGFHGRENKAG